MKKIGLFDSGCGGVSIIERLSQLNACEQLVFFADTAHAPYGDKSPIQLRALNDSIISFFDSQEVDTIIIGCNTSTSLFLEDFEEVYSHTFYGLVAPTCEIAVATSATHHLGVLATQRTVETGLFSSTIATLSPQASVTEVACPGLVEMVEQNMIDSVQCRALCSEYLHKLKDARIDTVILGCTHYPMLESVFKTIAEPHIAFINPAESLRFPSVSTKDALSVNVVVSGPHQTIESHVKRLDIPYTLSLVEPVA